MFPTQTSRLQPNHWAYDVSRDDQRFLMIQVPRDTVRLELVVVENWFTELKARAPTRP